jgi:hypothetical protein
LHKEVTRRTAFWQREAKRKTVVESVNPGWEAADGEANVCVRPPRGKNARSSIERAE